MRSIIAILLLSTAALILGGCGGNPQNNAPDVSDRISLAAKLEEKGLHTQAAREYEAALEQGSLSPQKRSNICYLLGNLYFEKNKDYETALAWYVRAGHYDPENPASRKITERSITCLERMGRSLDAQNVLSEATYLAGEETRRFGGKTVAQIGDRRITMGELDNEIQKLPPKNQEQFRTDQKARLVFLRQYIQNELLLDMAKRAGYHKNPELRDRVEDFEKMLLVQEVYKHKVQDQVKVSPEEVRLFFDAHKDEFITEKTRNTRGETTGTKPLDLSPEELFREKAPSITNTLRSRKAGKHEAALLEQLMQSQNVIIYEGEFD